MRVMQKGSTDLRRDPKTQVLWCALSLIDWPPLELELSGPTPFYTSAQALE